MNTAANNSAPHVIGPITTKALADVAAIGAEVARYGGGLATFAQSIDEIDVWACSNLRRDAAAIASVMAGADDVSKGLVTAALVDACKADDWAAKQIAGRFPSALRRFRLIQAIGRHRSAHRFGSLLTALNRGRFSRKQLAFAERLAAEVGA